MSYIYRVQDSDWRGPFKPGFTSQWIRLDIDEERFKRLNPLFPGAQFDPSKYTNPITGCHTTDQLREWFNKEEIERLNRYGYKVYKIKVDEIIYSSDIQCVANIQSKNVKRLHEINLYSIEEIQ